MCKKRIASAFSDIFIKSILKYNLKILEFENFQAHGYHIIHKCMKRYAKTAKTKQI